MACPTFKSGSEPLILGTGEAYPHHTYSQQEFLQALLEVRSSNPASSSGYCRQCLLIENVLVTPAAVKAGSINV